MALLVQHPNLNYLIYLHLWPLPIIDNRCSEWPNGSKEQKKKKKNSIVNLRMEWSPTNYYANSLLGTIPFLYSLPTEKSDARFTM